MKIDFLADTNFLIYVHEGNKTILPFLNFNFGISFISAVELLGFKGITKEEESKLDALLADCFELDWNSKIKAKTIEIRRTYNIKLPDAIIASTSIVYGIPLVTADRQFSKLQNMDVILIDI